MTWEERIVTLSIHPDMATRDDVARLAADLMSARAIVSEFQRGDKMLLEMLGNPPTIAEGITTLLAYERRV